MASALKDLVRKTWLVLDSEVATFRARIIEVDNKEWGIVDVLWKKPLEPVTLREYVEFVAKMVVSFVLPYAKRLIISSRAPIWFFVPLCHSVGHEFNVVATFDPKVQGAVICISHEYGYDVGNIVKLPPEIIAEITQVKV